MQRFRAAMAALAFLLLTAGAACRTDYTDDAVEKARAYALARTKDLTEPQRNFIRYATPEIWEDEFVNLQARFKKGIFSNETALFLLD